ncbi:uncharacterized protein LOC113305244 [Papaver somniferum]|uniref:uncharacterized protein LOC113305244 n=1 Tax=Papaver somniferum TaxID=3469 RepID=UPI000E6F7F13|nr:uncharacterized protein LOC113305244 [Papaver somniferum]
MRVREDDTWKTTFKIKQEYFVIVYLDVLIYKRTWEDHLVHVEKVFKVLHEGQLKLNVKKCDFGKEELVYLGFIVGGGQRNIDPSKVEVITKWPRPSTVTEIRSFLGACTYLCKFTRHFSNIARPLHGLTGAKAKFEWQQTHEDAFQLLKKNISEAPVLALPNLQRTFEVETDASNYAMGGVLLQDVKEGLNGEGKKLKPLRYGPFRILDQIGDNAFPLDLPPYLGIFFLDRLIFEKFARRVILGPGFQKIDIEKDDDRIKKVYKFK